MRYAGEVACFLSVYLQWSSIFLFWNTEQLWLQCLFLSPGYHGYPHRQSTSEPLLPFDSQTDEDEKPFSPPELVPIAITLDSESPLPPQDTSHDSMDQSHNSQTDTEACHITRSSNSSTGNNIPSVREQKSTPFQIAESEYVSEDQSQNAAPVTEQPTDDVKKSGKSDKYVSLLIRHQRNRGYESSDDDDVFLPDPIHKAMVSTATKDEPIREEVKSMCTVKASVPPVPPLIASTEEKPSGGSVVVVIKRGRGTAKTLDLQKLQLPLSQG